MVSGAPITEIALGCSGVIAGAVAAATWRNRPKKGAATLSLTVAAIAVGSFAQLAMLQTTAASTLLRLAGLTQFTFVATAMAWAVFAARYTGADDWLTRPRVGALVSVALLFGIVAVSNPASIVFTDPRVPAPGTLVFEWGPVALVGAALVTGHFWIAEYLLVRKLLRSRNVYRHRTAFFVLIGAIQWIAFVGTVLEIGVVPNHSLPQFAFLLVGVLSALVLWNYRILQYLPIDRLLALFGARFEAIARDVVIEEMGSGVLVFDAEDRVVDVNPIARRMLDAEGERIVGRQVADVVDAGVFVDGPPAFLDAAVTEGRFEGIWIDPTDGPRRCFDVVLTDLADKRDDVSGRVAIVHDVTEERRRKQQLERQTDELRRQNEHLEEFASILSHDLRNPLTVSRGHVSLAREEGDLDLLDTALDAHDRMETIIEDVLTLAREGRTVDETAPLGLADLARDAWETVDTAGAALQVTADPDRTVEADASRLRRAFENLFRNAVEHNAAPVRSARSAESGEADGEAQRPDPVADVAADGATAEALLSISVGELDDGFYVADDGDGIPEAERGRILDRGYTTSEDGSGFGLAIVQSIVEAHGWDLTVAESDAGGARFEVRGTGGVDEDLPLGE